MALGDADGDLDATGLANGKGKFGASAPGGDAGRSGTDGRLADVYSVGAAGMFVRSGRLAIVNVERRLDQRLS